MITQLNQLPPGTRFQLYKRHRDGSRRSPLRWEKRELNGVELSVVEINKGYVVVSLPDGVKFPMASSVRIKEADNVGYRSDHDRNSRPRRRKPKCP